MGTGRKRSRLVRRAALAAALLLAACTPSARDVLDLRAEAALAAAYRDGYIADPQIRTERDYLFNLRRGVPIGCSVDCRPATDAEILAAVTKLEAAFASYYER